MIIFNKTLTIEEANRLYTAKDGMIYPNTPHNRQMIKGLVSAQLKKLQTERDAKI